MAHFAELDEQNTVVRVVVISNDDIVDGNGVEQESKGIELCERHIGAGKWIQTSYNRNFRKMYAEVGFVYVEADDLFYDPRRPYPSWILNENYDWVPPIPYPSDGGDYRWNFDTETWDEIPTEEPAP